MDLRQSVCHSATVFANAMMHCGTTVDTFLRDNLEWLGRATNWAKFSATAGLGVIHKGTFTSQSMSFLNKTLGHLENSQALMSPYLPPNESSGSPYSEGGALFALGLIHANHGQGIQVRSTIDIRCVSNDLSGFFVGLAEKCTERSDSARSVFGNRNCGVGRRISRNRGIDQSSSLFRLASIFCFF